MPLNYTLTDDAGGKFVLVGNQIKSAAALTAGTPNVGVKGTDENGWSKTKTFGVPISPGSVVPQPIQMGSRFVVPTSGQSNNTDGNSNSRISSFNESGATAVKIRTYNVNWRLTTASEVPGTSPITISQSIEYPAGTFTQVTWGGLASTTIGITGDSLAESDEITLATPIPPGAQYWVRTYVSVAASGLWPQPYIIQYTGVTDLGELQDFATGVDKTMGGTITNVVPGANKFAYGPAAIMMTGWTGTPVAKSFVGMGDSRIGGSGDKYETPSVGHGNIGHMGKACANNFPYVNIGLGGSTGNTQVANMSRRLALLAKIKPTHMYVSYSHNDMLAGRTAAQIASDVSAIAQAIKTVLPSVKVIWPTDQPYTTSSTFFVDAAGQTIPTSPAGVFTGGAASVRSTFNNLLRAGISGVDYVLDVADLLETDVNNVLTRDGGLWRSGNGGVGSGYNSTYLGATGTTAAATTDGTHDWASTITAPGKGGIYIIRDAARAQFGSW